MCGTGGWMSKVAFSEKKREVKCMVSMLRPPKFGR